MAEVGGELDRKVGDRGPNPVERLQDDGGPVREERRNRLLVDLIADLGSDSPGAREPGGVDDDPILGEPKEGSSQPTT